MNYKVKGSFALGVEGFIRSMQNSILSATAAAQSLNSRGISVWAYANLSDYAQLVGRFDNFDPNTDAGSDGTNLILVGVQFNPIKDVSVTPNIEIFTHQATAPNGGDKSDVTPRVSFFWNF